jgi:Bacterial Ig domain
VQLLVVRQDQSAERSTILVTVDNQPPKVEILNPLANEAILKSARTSIVFLAEVEDNLGIDHVAFMVDGRLIARLIQPPFAISWTTVTGNHTLRLVATDEAGNTSETQSNFSVK